MTNPTLAPATCDEYLATLPWVDASPVQRELIEASIRRMWGMLERRVAAQMRRRCALIADRWAINECECCGRYGEIVGDEIRAMGVGEAQP